MLDRLKLVLASVIAVLSPLIPVLVTVTALVVTNLILDVIEAIKLKEAVKLSTRLIDSLVRLTFLLLSCIIAYHVQEYLTGPELPMLKIVTTMIGISEVHRFLTSMAAITNNPVFTSISSMISPPAKKEDSGTPKD